MNKKPTTKGKPVAGHDSKGRFVPGWKGGPGNPHASRVGAWRNALVAAVSPEDIHRVTAVLLAKAKSGEAWAVKEILDRCLGGVQQRMDLTVEGRLTWAQAIEKMARGVAAFADDAEDADENDKLS